MKYFILAVCLVFTISCKKNELSSAGNDNGCINRFTRRYISGSDSVAAATLLKSNNIPPENLRYYRVVLNDTVKNDNNGVVYVSQHIFAIQYFNGLPLFSSDLGFHFNSGVLTYSDGTRRTSINLNTVPVLSLSQVRKLFATEIYKNGFNIISKDSCMSAQFGYYDLNSQLAGASPNFVKAWLVTPENSDYPNALFIDGSGKTIYFNSGIETLN